MTTTSRLAWAGNTGRETGAQAGLAARVRVREDKKPALTPAPRRSGRVPANGESAFEISCITAQFGDARWTGEWRRLLAASRSPEKIYQTPEFFRFLADSHTSQSDRFELYVVKHRALDTVVGLVPVRISSIAFDVRLGARSLPAFAPRIVRILGSVPLMPDNAELLHQLFAHLLDAFPDCAAVSMQAFPAELQAQLHGDQRHAPSALHGWRDCHTIPLPDDVPAYMAKMSAKKRYNLARQYRLLEQATGPLELVRVDRSVNVRELVAGMAALAPDDAQAYLGARDYRIMAANRLLLSYVLRSAGEVIAVVAGSRYGDTWHVHQIIYAPAYRHLSAGAVALHAALQDVITHFAFASTHLLKSRAHVLVARRGAWSARLLGAAVRLDAWRDTCAQRIKPLARRLFRS